MNRSKCCSVLCDMEIPCIFCSWVVATTCGLHPDLSAVPYMMGGTLLSCPSISAFSQGFLTKTALSFREHRTNISKLHDGECKLEIGSVSVIEIQIHLLGLLIERIPLIYLRKCMAGLPGVLVHALASCLVRVAFETKRQRKRPQIFRELCCADWQVSLWRWQAFPPFVTSIQNSSAGSFVR